MSSRTGAFMLLLIFFFFRICSVSALTNGVDANALLALKSALVKPPKNWKGFDPCGTNWVGVTCNTNRVVDISLGNLNLEGKLPEDISTLSELDKLDLTSNPNLTGPLPPNIGNLKKLTELNLMGCGFSGQIPESIGSLEKLTKLSLNSNNFNGTIPASMGRLSKLYWFDIADNQIEGELPVSNGTTSPGLDMLLEAGHFHFGKNKLSGKIPNELFTSKMNLKHVLFDGNLFTGGIPDSLSSLVKTLVVLRLDRNRLSGEIPASLNNLTNLQELYLSDNKFTGSLPNLSNLTTLFTLDVSNNRFTSSLIPSWISSLDSLSTLRMEGIQLQGQIPISFFNHRNSSLETVVLKRNWLNETLDFGTSKTLRFVDLQYNDITEYKQPAKKDLQVILANNPVCPEVENPPDEYCIVVKQNSSYSSPRRSCRDCGEDREPNPDTCHCVYPATGVLTFRSPSFTGFSDSSAFNNLWVNLTDFFTKSSYKVESVAIGNIREDETDHHLLVNLLFFPLGKDRFNETGMNNVISKFSMQSYKPPERFGPYIFEANKYDEFPGEKSLKSSYIIGVVVGVSVFLLMLIIAGIYALKQKKRAERANEQINPFAKWDVNQNSVDAPQLMGVKAFSFEDMRKCANNFSMANDVGGGGYGQVYKGILPSGQQIAIKRAQPGSLQGALEFKTEIELLSRVHHRNVVKLLGFCFDRGEQMLIYEYIPNGSLRDSLSGKNGIRLDWTRRLRIALGSGKGLAYLHELADPPIIHRDVKSSNILLDESLAAKVADFGLSQLVEEAEKANVTAAVKGTMGYLDPEYYMTNQLTEKSDVYGFGVMMLELLTGEIPIVNGKYVVKEVKMKMNKSKKLYDLQELLDSTIIATNENLKGFEKYVDLALICVDPEGVNRPSMNEVVKEIEYIMHHAGLNPNGDLAASSRTFDEASKGFGDPYGNNSFEYSASFPTAKIEPH
ncbi:probable leucine-rich repeat receptor-like protein kinase At5g49770 [Capsella rubella]|uniref:probable leucine-rich repeat receptor-like protein kinase At5g49770 n=1 Tax=Capsella rubella TaxID=81985 RepID=UPI000CD50E57|nr:probable leucine-rich repeat receptor-like protein kinase At5g49770 [Capsella rubella]